MNIERELTHLKCQMSHYKEVMKAISPESIGYSELTSVIGPILVLNHTSLESIVLLAENDKYRDLIILSRPFLESVINIGFICANNEAVIASKKYAYQKGYRDLFRDLDINGFSIKSGFSQHIKEFENSTPENLKEAISDFTLKNGREKMSWVNENTKEKLELIGKTYGEYVNGLLTFAFYAIYRDVSEIIHNSYYGARIFLGMQQKDITMFRDSAEAAEYFGQHQIKLATLIIQQINISINSLINILKQKFLLDSVKEIFENSNTAMIQYASSLDEKNS